jgi:hypothetical protein
LDKSRVQKYIKDRSKFLVVDLGPKLPDDVFQNLSDSSSKSVDQNPFEDFEENVARVEEDGDEMVTVFTKLFFVIVGGSKS